MSSIRMSLPAFISKLFNLCNERDGDEGDVVGWCNSGATIYIGDAEVLARLRTQYFSQPLLIRAMYASILRNRSLHQRSLAPHFSPQAYIIL